MLGFSISYLDFIKFPFFVTSLKEGMGGWTEAQRWDDFKENSSILSGFGFGLGGVSLLNASFGVASGFKLKTLKVLWNGWENRKRWFSQKVRTAKRN